jgi:hypothetical protein
MGCRGPVLWETSTGAVAASRGVVTVVTGVTFWTTVPEGTTVVEIGEKVVAKGVATRDDVIVVVTCGGDSTLVEGRTTGAGSLVTVRGCLPSTVSLTMVLRAPPSL